MGHGHHIEIKQEQYTFSPKTKRFTIILMVLGLVLAGIGIANLNNDSHSTATEHKTEANANVHDSHGKDASAHGDHAAAASHDEHAEHGNVPNEQFGPRAEYHSLNKPATTRIFANLLVAGYFFLMISLAALFWYAIQYVANAGWSAAIKRVPEAVMTFIPVPLIVILVVLFLDKNNIYHWAHYEHLHLKPEDAGYDKILDGKSGFLNSTLLFAFPAILVTIWYLLSRKLRSLSIQEDSASKGDVSFFKKSIRYSATFAVIFGFTISIIVWLLIMSVDSHWYSTIFGIYNFITHWVSAITIMAIIILYLKKEGYFGIVTAEHMHDLGKFMFAFTVFWAYVWLSQYLLIWYAQIPEEMYYYQIRWEEYHYNFIINFALCFCVPFLGLLMRSAKRNPVVMTVIGIILILGHYHDVWFMVFPGVFGPGMQIGLLEIGTFLFFSGVFLFWVFTALTKRGLIAVNHPYLEESVYHDTGV
jgi:hypothetical protein